MTTRPTDEEIRAMRQWAHRNRGDIGDKVYQFAEAWLAERQAARDGVTSEVVQKAYNALLADMDPIEGVSLGCMRKALKVVSTEIRITEVTDEMIDKAMTAYDEFLGAEDESDYEAMSAALQSIAQPITSVSDALNFLEEWALSGKTLHGDDIQRFRSTVERIAPIEHTVRVPDGWVDELQLIGAVLHGYSPSIARDDAIRAVRKLLSAALDQRQEVTDDLVYSFLKAQMDRVSQGNCTAFDSVKAALQSIAIPVKVPVAMPETWQSDIGRSYDTEDEAYTASFDANAKPWFGHTEYANGWNACREAMLSNSPQPQQVPDGWKLVPINADKVMRVAGEREWRHENLYRIWEAMLSAAPAYNGKKEE